MYTKDVLNTIWKFKLEHVNIFDDDFLVSKDEALQPINIFFGSEDKEDLNNSQIKNKKLSLKITKENDEEKRSAKSKRSQKSQKSTSNTNKKSARKKSIRNSQLYSSNIIIINDEEDEDRSPTDPIGKEIEKIKKLMARSKKKKKKKNKKTSQSLTKQ
jgi:hypothetical protein